MQNAWRVKKPGVHEYLVEYRTERSTVLYSLY